MTKNAFDVILKNMLANAMLTSADATIIDTSNASSLTRDAFAILKSLHDMSKKPHKMLNAENLDSLDVFGWLSGLAIANQDVYVIWLPFASACAMKWTTAIEHILELWFPSRDDLVIMPIDKSFIIYIDHEERIFYYDKIAC